jgi:hypothetical protein
LFHKVMKEIKLYIISYYIILSYNTAYSFVGFHSLSEVFVTTTKLYGVIVHKTMICIRIINRKAAQSV